MYWYTRSAAREFHVQRLFFALWPAPALQRQLHALVDPLLPQTKGGRRLAVENLHLTLAFLGAVDAAKRPCIEQRANEIRAAPFQLLIDRLVFVKRKGILWAAPSHPVPALLDLVRALQDAQAACGLPRESREYQTHITLMRDLRHCPPALVSIPVVWSVQQFALVQSRTEVQGARYDVLRTWEL